MEEKDIIEVEVLSETTAEAEGPKEPKKNVTYRSKADKAQRLFTIARPISKWVTPAIFFCGAAGLTFSILYSQGPTPFRFVLMLFMWSATLACLITSIIGFLLHRRGMRYMEEESQGK